MQITNKEILDFSKESNDIEGIVISKANWNMYQLLKKFIYEEELTLENIKEFALGLDPRCVLRTREGMDVRIGSHIPERGGPGLIKKLEGFIGTQNNNFICDTPFDAYQQFETLHPFMDGNGRTGRAIWLRQMIQEERYNALGFLKLYHYQTFDAFRNRSVAAEG